MISNSELEIFNSRGRVLVHIASHPGCILEDITEGLYLTPRTVWGIIGELRRADMLQIRKKGRRHYYRVNLNAAFHHPSVAGYSLDSILGEIAR